MLAWNFRPLFCLEHQRNHGVSSQGSGDSVPDISATFGDRYHLGLV